MRLIALIGCMLLHGQLFAQDAYADERGRMVETQIADRGIDDPATLRAMRVVPRHLLVPESQRGRAYDDSPLPIGYGQTISQPFMVGYMTEIIRPQEGQRILEIGTGSGYQAAILAEIIDTVYTIEIITELHRTSSARLRSLGYENVRTRNADGYHGWEDAAPFDAIVVTAAAEHIPPPLIKQLKDGGLMVIPVGSPYFVQTLILVERKGNDYTTRSLMPVRFVPFTRGE
jgi:protein-L-isoaspartate(D-aspartate) O-methyltransferase